MLVKRQVIHDCWNELCGVAEATRLELELPSVVHRETTKRALAKGKHLQETNVLRGGLV